MTSEALTAVDDTEWSFSVEDMQTAADYPVLGPEYAASRRIAAEFMEKFTAEQFAPLVDNAARAFRDALWPAFADYLMSDTQDNVHEGMRRMVAATVNAIIKGDQWSLERYPLASGYDGEAVRKAIFEHCREQMIDVRVTELEAENKRLRESLEYARRY